MAKKTLLVAIPARFNSEEIFCKTLADIGDKPMIQHVYERVSKAKDVTKVIIATDHEKIKLAVEKFGAQAILTSNKHICGTDRIIEAYNKLREKFDVIVDVQADEPFLEPEMINEVTGPLLGDNKIPMATLCCEFETEKDWEYPFNVKVLKNLDGFALYFTRAPVPYPRKKGEAKLFQHIGIYAWQGWFLEKFPKGPSYLENAESLEQLRVLEAGFQIKVVETRTKYRKISVNTHEDLEKARQLFKKTG